MSTAALLWKTIKISRDFDLLLVEGVREAYGVFSAVVMLVFALLTVFVAHMVCSQMS